ncbi:DoxX family protein [Roseomonas populi]|uniref:DoxX family protein n=1 Tax=Roseomonas populi TaxID=3121582 RepID=A0ABT1X2N4_9PROT|nr:DoxX family protein [Roseomonas pecuniae]MCR0982357.1 DoxX family protein [Roseomonas pecuniae]
MSPTARRALTLIGLLGLCAAYLQGGLNKLVDYPGAVAEAAHFGLPLPPVVAALTIALELGASAMILSGWFRRLGALGLMAFTLAATLIANRYWELPGGMERFMMANSFYEHLGLAGAFLLVALHDRRVA